MTGPKHLWSGDWESESARTADDLATAPAPVFDPEPEPEPEPRVTATRRWSRRQLAVALTTGIAAAAVTVGLVTALNGPNHKPTPHNKVAAAPATRTPGPTGGAAPITACQQTPASCAPTAVASGPTADWMGMQIVTSSGGVVISTVRLNSPADRAGFEPGDQIQQIAGHQVSNMDQVRRATAGVTLGKTMSIEVLRDSVNYAASMPLTARPTIHP
jgi:membrane-associated protease RseP (regulator of RpoE activity)